jgi:hypothetical protein
MSRFGEYWTPQYLEDLNTVIIPHELILDQQVQQQDLDAKLAVFTDPQWRDLDKQNYTASLASYDSTPNEQTPIMSPSFDNCNLKSKYLVVISSTSRKIFESKMLSSLRWRDTAK